MGIETQDRATALTRRKFGRFLAKYGEDFYPICEAIALDDYEHKIDRRWGRPNNIEAAPRAFLGSTSTTLMYGDQVKKYVDFEQKESMCDKITWGEVARKTLWLSGEPYSPNRMFPSVPPYQRVQISPLPLYFGATTRHQRSGRFCYVDVIGAFAQFLRRLPGPAINYDPSRHWCQPHTNWQWPTKSVLNDKWLGRVLVGTMRRTKLQYMVYGQFHETPNLNYYCPQTVAWITDVCHAIAREAVDDYGCLRWHTDGGIFPASAGEEFLEWLADLWEIEAVIKAEGYGYISDVNTWQIGDQSTLRFARDAEDGYRMVLSPDGTEQKVWTDPLLQDYEVAERTATSTLKPHIDTSWIREVYLGYGGITTT